ncbi:MAG: peptide-methionine (S)-S-oxide reductase MsrA [Terrisporobacter othiniensis]|uniref:peptide-methionine (S)-S-oxide reductase MsrA n=1 Tax=Terrisporobacter petrolearius TaxID=1460447 RepID=UPI0022E65F3D|nr:peptide-methionine (S)-S-oxide reductase MsrA [Terrisporobacter petrolearius]MDU4862101.1 peptide-methionine (S)-S-oxide reductase MsrA [Terrisporobacter othiniensis]MDU6993208.1 peptide-methionine (S)-S-oxide reductase MsrA [Terrisporobacter othiniensis]
MEKTAMFAGGCFWCMVEPFEKLKGVKEVKVGYSGGTNKNPTFEIVSNEDSNHYLVVKITYDDEILSYNELLEVYFNSIDPTDEEGQFGDKSYCFKTAIFYYDIDQWRQAQRYIEDLEENNIFGDLIATKLYEAKTFYEAEDFHQNFYKKNPVLYREYIRFSGRYEYLKRSYAMRHLNQLQYEVTQNKLREKPFKNQYCNYISEGVYVDVLDNTPLFSSKDKINKNYGWPTFSKAINNNLIKLIKDEEIVNKIEVRSKKSDIHLGYVLNDTLEDLKHNILSINSAAIKFIPANK